MIRRLIAAIAAVVPWPRYEAVWACSHCGWTIPAGFRGTTLAAVVIAHVGTHNASLLPRYCWTLRRKRDAGRDGEGA